MVLFGMMTMIISWYAMVWGKWHFYPNTSHHDIEYHIYLTIYHISYISLCITIYHIYLTILAKSGSVGLDTSDAAWRHNTRAYIKVLILILITNYDDDDDDELGCKNIKIWWLTWFDKIESTGSRVQRWSEAGRQEALAPEAAGAAAIGATWICTTNDRQIS